MDILMSAITIILIIITFFYFIFFDTDEKYERSHTSNKQNSLNKLCPSLARFSKLDGVVTENELTIVNEYVSGYINPTKKQMNNLKKIFNKEKSFENDFSMIIRLFITFLNNHNQPTEDIGGFLLHTFLKIAYSNTKDNNIHSNHQQGIYVLIEHFNISLEYYENLKHNYATLHTNYEDDKLDYYYKLLKCDENSTEKYIKKKYRELSKRYHPDTVASKDLDPAIVEMVSSKFKEINKAYKIILEHSRYR